MTASIISLTASKIGWAAGGGIEYAFMDNLTARAEFLYIATSGIGGTAPITPLLGGGTGTETVDLKDSIVRFGLNYKFGGGSVVAR